MKSTIKLFALLLSVGVLFAACSKQETANVKPQVEKKLDSELDNSNAERSFCQCVEYVKNRYYIVGGVGYYGGAKDYGPILTNSNNDFEEEYYPENKDIIVIQPEFGKGIDRTYGHIALVGRVRYNSDDSMDITIYGANQGGSQFYEHGCSNVSSMKITVNKYNRRHVAFYRNMDKFIR